MIHHHDWAICYRAYFLRQLCVCRFAKSILGASAPACGLSVSDKDCGGRATAKGNHGKILKYA